jgi:hypothetical protein
VTETADLSTETFRLASILAAVNGGLAALGVAIAYYVYSYVPHSSEVHYTARYGEVVSSAATYISVFPVFQIFVFVGLSALPAWWGSYRRHGLQQSIEFRKNWQRPVPDRDTVFKVVSIASTAFELIALVGTASRSMVVAYGL